MSDPSAEGSSHPGTSRLVGWAIGLVVIGVGLGLILWRGAPPPRVDRGVPAPDFTLERLGDEPTSLSDFAGQVVLVNFWATWCKPCEDEIPAMGRLYAGLRDEGFEILAISVDERAEDVERFRERLGIAFPILLDPEQSTSRAYQTTGYPESLLVDRGGQIVERYVGPRDWDHPRFAARIRQLLAP